MQSILTNKKSFIFLFAIVSITFIGLFAAGIIALNSNKDPHKNNDDDITPTLQPTSTPIPTTEPEPEPVSWLYIDNKWVSNGDVPDCPNPIVIKSPVDISKATTILYPGQYRGTHYKAHGGVRFDNNKNNNVNVYMPINSKLIGGSRYFQDGTIQYLLDFIAPCGLRVRFDHILKVTDELYNFIDKELPAPKENDTRGTFFTIQKEFKTGDLIATQIGMKNPLNVGVDFGFYDLRQRNKVSQNPSWLSRHPIEGELNYHGLCWLDLLPEPDRSKAKALPGPGTEGKTSDYCD